MPRFVILEHNYPAKHWDFLLEEGNCLRAWKLLESPQAFLLSPDGQEKVLLKAEGAANHRLIYLDYEGPISGNRGEVKRFDFGTFSYIEQNDQTTKIDLQGVQLKGVFRLSQKQSSWLFETDQ